MRGIRRFGCALGVAVIGFAGPAAAWGPEGHTVIARVATAHLKAQAAVNLRWIASIGVLALNAEISQKYGMKCQIDPANPWGPVPDYKIDKDQHTNLANWPDCYRYLDASTSGWHFNDIPLGQAVSGPLNASAQTWCVQPQSCASAALADNLRKLATPGRSPAQTAMALAFVAHLMGDIHQPLHEEDNRDLGGNRVLIVTDASGVSATKLHELWDVQLVEFALGTDLDAATQTLARQASLLSKPTFAKIDDVIAASDGWAEETHDLALPAYAQLNVPVGAGPVTGVAVDKTYLQRQLPVVQTQMALAAVRLEAALNIALAWSPPP